MNVYLWSTDVWSLLWSTWIEGIYLGTDEVYKAIERVPVTIDSWPTWWWTPALNWAMVEKDWAISKPSCWTLVIWDKTFTYSNWFTKLMGLSTTRTKTDNETTGLQVYISSSNYTPYISLIANNWTWSPSDRINLSSYDFTKSISWNTVTINWTTYTFTPSSWNTFRSIQEQWWHWASDAFWCLIKMAYVIVWIAS